MPKKVVIKENTIEAPEETREEILEQVEQAEAQPPTAPEPPPPPPPQQQPTQKAEGRTRMRELYRCEYCNKYLTKKSLNYSHAKYCKGQQPEQVEEPPPEEIPEETSQEPPQTRMSLMTHIREEQRRLKHERIRMLARH